MRVVVPHVGTIPSEVLAPLPHPELRDVGGSDRAYFDLLAELWATGKTFIIVEHDIVVHASAVAELSVCPHNWCGFPHDMGPAGIQYGLGCVKFSAALIARNPDAVIRAGILSDARHPPRYWCRLDAWLQGVILPPREDKHHHETAVRHLGSGDSHGCLSH